MKRAQQDLKKKRADDERLMKSWRNWHAEQLQECLASAEGALVAEVMALLDQIELSSAAALVDHMRRTDWSSISANTRFTLLHQVNQSIVLMRERNGLPGIDDPIPPRASAFFAIKNLLFPNSPAKAGS
jgi:hypothetical protein